MNNVAIVKSKAGMVFRELFDFIEINDNGLNYRLCIT